MTGRKKGNWSATELGRLRVLYPTCSEDRVASLLNRSVSSVRVRAKRLFARPTHRGDWTEDEDHQLRISYGVLDIKCLALVLARSERDIRERIKYLRKSRRAGPWSSEELVLLKRLYGSRADVDLEVCLSRSRRHIAQCAARLCLSKDKKLGAANGLVRMPRWSMEEEGLLAELYPDRDNLEIARRLGRTVASVASKANLLGLKKSRSALREMGRRNVSIRYRETEEQSHSPGPALA